MELKRLQITEIFDLYALHIEFLPGCTVLSNLIKGIQLDFPFSDIV